jgi:hypothetical protein
MSLSMQNTKNVLLAEFPVNGKYLIGIYQGSLSEFDILIKYRQKENGKWSRIRTPKHIHWAVDILIKHYCDEKTTDKLLDFLLKLWDNTNPIKTKEEREILLNTNSLLDEVNKEAANYVSLANHGEYSIKFLILLAKLLMIQEKTNRNDAYMFKRLLEQLKDHSDIFRIVSTATLH